MRLAAPGRALGGVMCGALVGGTLSLPHAPLTPMSYVVQISKYSYEHVYWCSLSRRLFGVTYLHLSNTQIAGRLIFSDCRRAGSEVRPGTPPPPRCPLARRAGCVLLRRCRGCS
jgi:hypothetical protein